MDTAEVLAIIAECKRELRAKGSRVDFDALAVSIISHEAGPLRMARSLDAWIGGNWLARTPPEVMEKLESL